MTSITHRNRFKLFIYVAANLQLVAAIFYRACRKIKIITSTISQLFANSVSIQMAVYRLNENLSISVPNDVCQHHIFILVTFKLDAKE